MTRRIVHEDEKVVLDAFYEWCHEHCFEDLWEETRDCAWHTLSEVPKGELCGICGEPMHEESDAKKS